jgi:hypothetical protein
LTDRENLDETMFNTYCRSVIVGLPGAGGAAVTKDDDAGFGVSFEEDEDGIAQNDWASANQLHDGFAGMTYDPDTGEGGTPGDEDGEGVEY